MLKTGVLDSIEWMMTHGSSLTLNWGEDTDFWEVDWISSGDRFRGVSKDLGNALFAARMKAQQALDEKRGQNEHPTGVPARPSADAGE